MSSSSDGTQSKLWCIDAFADAQIAHAAREVQAIRKLITGTYGPLSKAEIADVCAGNGEKLNGLSGIANLYAFEIDEEAVEKARLDYPNIKHVAGDYAVTLPEAVKQRGMPFDIVTCFGNSLGTLQGDRAAHVRAMAECGDALFVSVFHNSPAVMLKRLEYYVRHFAEPKLERLVLNQRTGTITSELWGDSEAFTEQQLLDFAADLKPLGYTDPLVVPIEPIGIALWVTRG